MLEVIGRDQNGDIIVRHQQSGNICRIEDVSDNIQSRSIEDSEY